MTDPVRDITDNPPAPAGRKMKCEFCECSLSAAGEVLQMSDRARELRRLEDALRDEQRNHTATKGEIATAKARIDELEGQLRVATAPKEKKNWLTDDEIP